MKHVAYVFDALIYYMRSGNDLDLKNAPAVVIEQQQVKFIYSEKATKFFEISTNYLSYVLQVK